MQNTFDVAIVGGGIVGLAHAWLAAEQGLSVVVLERSARASGASIRNFGMIWPIGQPPGERLELALRSRERWLQLGKEADLWVNPCGSLHVAHRTDEFEVIREFCESTRSYQLPVEILSPAETLQRSPAVRSEGLLGSLWSPLELCVNPRRALQQIPTWLASRHGVVFHFDCHVHHVGDGQLDSAAGRRWQAEQILICSGSDFLSLFPAAYQQAGLRRCKLQMLRTVPQAERWRIGPHLASGLTLRHYAAFAACPAVQDLRQRIAAETPELDRFGIHVMAAQDDEGHIILGDSHEYDEEISTFDKREIDELILRELRRQFTFPDWTIDLRWHGYYAKDPADRLLRLEPVPGVQMCFSPGGAGMTLSFGWAEEFWKSRVDKNV